MSRFTLPTDERVEGGAALLLERNGRRQTFDAIDFRDAHPIEQPPGVGGHGFEISPLRFRKQCHEGQRCLTRPRNTGEHHQRAPGEAADGDETGKAGQSNHR